jgi:hypothetical protein
MQLFTPVCNGVRISMYVDSVPKLKKDQPQLVYCREDKTLYSVIAKDCGAACHCDAEIIDAFFGVEEYSGGLNYVRL